MSDHRDIPGIEFVSCPGPLRLGDYTCPQSRGPTTEITRIDGSIPLLTKGLWSIWRVIPVIKPLDVPEEVDAELSPEIGTIEGDAHTTEFAAAHDKGFCLYADSLGRYRLAWPDNSDQPLDGWVRFVATGKRGKATE